MGASGEIAESEAELERIGGSFDPANPLRGKWRVVPVFRLAKMSFGLRLHSLDMSYEGKFDAKEYPLEGSSQYDAVRMAMIDRAAALEVSYVKGGQVKVVTELRVSEDGRTLRIAEVGGDSEARPLAVFDRIP